MALQELVATAKQLQAMAFTPEPKIRGQNPHRSVRLQKRDQGPAIPQLHQDPLGQGIPSHLNATNVLRTCHWSAVISDNLNLLAQAGSPFKTTPIGMEREHLIGDDSRFARTESIQAAGIKSTPALELRPYRRSTGLTGERYPVVASAQGLLSKGQELTGSAIEKVSALESLSTAKALLPPPQQSRQKMLRRRPKPRVNQHRAGGSGR